MNSNIIPIRRPNDADVFLQACNSPAQQARREQRRKAQRRKTQLTTATLHTALIAVGIVLGYILGNVI